jgi:hypothetical protein
MEGDDRFLLPRLQSEISGNPPIVLIHSPIALAPRPATRDESFDTDLGLLGPTPHEIHHLVPHIMRHPGLG